MKHLYEFKDLNHPVMVGISRKSMIYKLLSCTQNDSLNGTTVLNTYALMNGANLLRVHDVKAATEAVKLIKQICRNAFTINRHFFTFFIYLIII